MAPQASQPQESQAPVAAEGVRQFSLGLSSSAGRSDFLQQVVVFIKEIEAS